MSYQLSILICTINSRSLKLGELLYVLNKQADEFPGMVQVLYLGDNKSMTVGRKRNQLIEISDGKYIVFVDDDDKVEPDYVRELVLATANNTDVICFDVMRYEEGVQDRLANYSHLNARDANLPTHYVRLPNHLMCVRRDIAIRVPFLDISFGEDGAWAKMIKPHLKTEHRILKTLYHYYFSKKTTETQQHLNA